MLVNEDSGGSEFVGQPIEVNINGIEDFAALLAHEMDASFRPSADRVIRQHADGVGFGSRNASLDMRIAVHKYFECLSAAVDNLREFIAASEILIQAGKKIAAAYREAEDDAQSIQRKVDGALKDTADEIDASRQGGRDEAMRAAMHRRLAQFERGEPI